MKIGCFCPVWRESRYLPLILEQMALCPGPALITWQDKPLFWYGKGEPPSGHADPKMRALLEPDLRPDIFIHKIDQAPRGEKFGGYAKMLAEGFDFLRSRGVETVVMMDADWIFSLNDMREIYRVMLKDWAHPHYFDTQARFYWRDWNHLFASTGITVGFPVTSSPFARGSEPTIKLPQMCYHPAYVLTDEEMHDKVKAWGHADDFERRGFYEKEWLAKDDSLVKPYDADITPPADVIERLIKHGAWL